MKNLILLLILTFTFHGLTRACSCSSEDPFCFVQSSNASWNVFLGVIIAENDSLMKLNILNKLRGSEPKDTINIWNDESLNGTSCEDSLRTMAKYIGNIGDTFLIVLPKVNNQHPTSIKYSTSTGDYMRPFDLCSHPAIPVFTDSLRGVLDGTNSQPVSNSVVALSDFLNYWSPGLSDCGASTVGLPSFTGKGNFQLYPNPTTGLVKLPNHEKIQQLKVFNLQGKLMHELNLPKQAEVDLSGFEKGLYLLQLQFNDGSIKTGKVVKE